MVDEQQPNGQDLGYAGPNEMTETELEGEADSESNSLSNICYDVLERIFDYLDLECLMHMAGTCKRLQSAAAIIFGKRYGNKHIYLCRINANAPLYKRHTPGIYTPYGPVKVIGLKFCLPLLRHFGAKITHLEVDYTHVSDPRNARLERYINQYCASTLKYFLFRNGYTFATESFSKPFQNVDRISMAYFALGNSLPNFVNWFPNLRQMDILRVDIDAQTMAVTFPHLVQLSLFLRPTHIQNDLTNSTAVNLLRANPQLQHLKLYFHKFRLSELFDLIGGNESLSHVIFDGEISDMNADDFNRLRSEHSSLVNLELRNSVGELD